MYKSTITFWVFTKKNNFAFKDILKIQNDIINNLTKLIAFILTELSPTQVEDFKQNQS